MKNSLKQLFRTPGKTILFFVMITAAALLLVVGAVMMADTLQKLQAADEQFSTIGTIEQKPDWEGTDEKGRPIKRYDEILSPDVLNFEGADYVVPPEARSCCLTYVPEVKNPALKSWGDSFACGIVEFVPEEDYEGNGEEVTIYLKHFLTRRQSRSSTEYLIASAQYSTPTLDDVLRFEEGGKGLLISYEPVSMKKGKTYIAAVDYSFWWNDDYTQGSFEMYMNSPPYSTQADSASDEPWMTREDVRTGALEPDDVYRAYYRPAGDLYDEVTEDFYETTKGKGWLAWADLLENYPGWWYVLPTGGMDLLPSFQNAELRLFNGREITPEEFASGARVCMLSSDFANRNFLSVGDKVTLPLYCSLRNYVPGYDDINCYRSGTDHSITSGSFSQNFEKGYSPLDENLELYEPYWEAEYEIVGLYRYVSVREFQDRYETELPREVFIIPSGSIGASDEGHVAYTAAMNPLTASFQIENGAIEEFDARLRSSVPEIDRFIITYSDGGYGEMRTSLEEARLTAMLLCGAGVFAAMAIVALALYFFVVKQRKRTAIERGLGMTRRQCRRSILSGLMVLTAGAAVLGSGTGALLMKLLFIDRDSGFNTGNYLPYFSLWAMAPKPAVVLDPNAWMIDLALYAAVPLSLVVAVYLLARLLIDRSLKIDPILLLGSKTE